MKRDVRETEAAVNYIIARLNDGDVSYWPGTEITVHPLDARGHCLPPAMHVVTEAEYVLAAKRNGE